MAYQTRYPQISRIDAHNHIGRSANNRQWADWLTVRDVVMRDTGADIAAWVDLDGGANMPGWAHRAEDGLEQIRRYGKGRILPTLSDSRPAQRLESSTPAQVAARKAAGFCGYKWHWNAGFNGGKAAAHGLINDAYFFPWYAAMQAAGFPLVALHLEAPHGDMDAQRAALYDVMDRYPELVVIQAHFGAQRHGTLDQHAKLFEKYPNFYRDISTTAQNMPFWASVNESRAFFEAYSHRLLWGTDNMTDHKGSAVQVSRLVKKCALQFEYWETSNMVPLDGIGGGGYGDRTDGATHVAGMALSEAALKRVYWENAIRLLPNLRELLIALGYNLGTDTMLAPTNLRANTTRLLWGYTKVAALTGFRVRVPSLSGGDPKTIDVGRDVRRVEVASLALGSGSHVIDIRALGAGGEASDWVSFPAILIGQAPGASQVCVDYSKANPTADWTISLGDVTSFRVKIDDVEMIQGGPNAVSARLPALAAGPHTLVVEGMKGSVAGTPASVSFSLASSAKTCSGVVAGTGVFTSDHANNKIRDPAGNLVALRGYRVGRSETQRPLPAIPSVEDITSANVSTWINQAGGSVAGNCQSLEVWWSSDIDFGPGEPDPRKPGVFNRDNLANLKDRIKVLKAAGIYVIISVRVSYDDDTALGGGPAGSRVTTGSPQGWANHNSVVNNDAVLGNAATYGRHGDRFFDWLEWFVPALSADTEVAENIAYWEMWHYFGHKHNSLAIKPYLDTFMPRLIKHYRDLDPQRLHGAGLVADALVGDLVKRLSPGGSGWVPWHHCSANTGGDKNLLYVIGGYGVLSATRRYDEKTGLPIQANLQYPQDSVNPAYLVPQGKLNIEVLRELMVSKGYGGAFHQQEGPGLANWWRRTPIPQPARRYFIGLLNDYNRLTNGFSIHSWPPLWTNFEMKGAPGYYTRKPTGAFGTYNETEAKLLLQKAMRGELLT